MTKQEFLDKLKSKLLEAGLSEEVCDQRCATISRGFSKLSEDEARQYFTNANVDMIVDRLLNGNPKSSVKPQNKTTEPPKPSEPIKKPEPPKQPANGKSTNAVDTSEATPTIVIPKSNGKGQDTAKGADKQSSNIAKVSGSDDVVFVSHPTSGQEGTGKHSLFISIDDSVMSKSSQHPKLLLAAIIALCAPMFLFVVLSILGLSLAIALVMASAILAVVCVIAAIVCGGSILSAVGLIYGLTQIISEPRYVGFHEIGLAMVFAGATILISVLLYNVAVRLIPFIYKLIGKGLKILFKKIRELTVLAWKGCKSL